MLTDIYFTINCAFEIDRSVNFFILQRCNFLDQSNMLSCSLCYPLSLSAFHIEFLQKQFHALCFLEFLSCLLQPRMLKLKNVNKVNETASV